MKGTPKAQVVRKLPLPQFWSRDSNPSRKTLAPESVCFIIVLPDMGSGVSGEVATGLRWGWESEQG